MSGWPLIPESALDAAHHISGATIRELRAVISYDAATGLFFRVGRRGLKSAGHVDRSKSGYMFLYVFGFRYRAHVLMYALYSGRWPSNVVDHIDGNKLNNAFLNLRDVPCYVNSQNRFRAASNSQSGLLGIKQDKRDGSWEAKIAARGVRFYLGRFQCPLAAHEAYLQAKRELHDVSGAVVARAPEERRAP